MLGPGQCVGERTCGVLGSCSRRSSPCRAAPRPAYANARGPISAAKTSTTFLVRERAPLCHCDAPFCRLCKSAANASKPHSIALPHLRDSIPCGFEASPPLPAPAPAASQSTSPSFSGTLAAVDRLQEPLRLKTLSLLSSCQRVCPSLWGSTCLTRRNALARVPALRSKIDQTTAPTHAAFDCCKQSLLLSFPVLKDVFSCPQSLVTILCLLRVHPPFTIWV